MRKIDPVSEWLDTVSYQYSQSKKTEEQYKRVWGRFTASAETSAEAILSDYQKLIQQNSGYDTFKRKYARTIRNWICQLSKEGLTNISINVMVGAVKSFFKWNDLPLGRIPQAKHGETFHNKDITKEEIVQILAILKIREKAFCAVMTQSGLRPVTIAKLRMKNLESLDKIPCKIDVPDKIAKGKYGSHITFIGEDAVKYLKRYLATRLNLTPESLVFCSHIDPVAPVNVKDVSRAFRLAARKLQESGAINYEVREGKPSELRLYNLRKFFRKYAIQMGFEVVEYMMGHTVKGVDGNYRPQDPEYYRELYADKAMPFLRLETSSPLETEKAVTTLEKENRDLKANIKKLEVTMEKIYLKVFQEKIEKEAHEKWLEEHAEEMEKEYREHEEFLRKEEEYLAKHPKERKRREEEEKARDEVYLQYLKDHEEEIEEQEKWVKEEAIRLDERRRTLGELQDIIKKAKKQQ